MDEESVLRPESAEAWGADPRAILTALSSAVYRWNILSDRIEWGANAAMLFGWTGAGRIGDGRSWRRLLSSRSAVGRDEAILVAAQTDEGAGVPFRARYEIVLPRGPVVVEDQGRWFAGVDRKPALAHGIVRLVDLASRAAESHLDIGAAARGELLKKIELAIGAAQGNRAPFAMLVGCLRDYRTIDAQHGSEEADEVVSIVLSRLRDCMRQSDYLVRYASNRFALLLGRCARDEIEGAAARLSSLACAEPVEVTTGSFSPSLAWGGLCDLQGSPDPRHVLRRCEEAMQDANGRGVEFSAYAPDRRRDSRRQIEQALAEDAIRALNDRRILIARQPIVSAGDRSVRFEEALLRKRSENGEIAPARDVVPLLEKLGRIEMLDQRVLELVIHTLIAEPAAVLSFNVSTSTLRNDAWMTTLSSAIVGQQDLADRLIVELTESQAIEDVERTRKIFSRLKAMGLRTAIDDFGAGYTSFKHLRTFDVDILKIDGAFVQNIARSADDSFFVRTLIDLAQHLGMETVAEWVSDEPSARRLAGWGVTYLQGDIIGPAAIREEPGEKGQAA